MTKPGVRVMGLTGKRSDVVVLPPARFNDTGVVEMSAPATTLANLTIRDRDPLTCFGLGVVVDNGAGPFAEASLIENVTVRMDFASVSECAFFADGTGVKIGGREAGAVPGRAVVHRSTIMGRSEGVEVFAGSTAGIRHNVIARLFGAANQSDGAVTMEGGTARVVRNDLSGYSAGVLLFHGGHVLIGGPGNGNEIHDSIVGVTLIGGDSEGVRATVADNDIHHNESSGVFVETPDAVVARNRIRDNGSTGISLTSTASGNRILHNVATGNDAGSPGAVDCSDESTGTGTAGTANTWIGNIGGSSSPPGIC
jgi:parallel beta-helix repeat protein